MKRKVSFILGFTLLLLVSCLKEDSNNHEIISEDIDEVVVDEMANETNLSEVMENEGYQSEDKMLSTYREGPHDGYSWRYREIDYIMEDENLSKEKLLSTLWLMDSDINQYALLVFYSDDVFKIGTYQAGVSIQGNYRIENSRIFLSNYNSDEYMDRFITMDDTETECEINFDSMNVKFRNEIAINGTSFFPIGSETQNGDNAIIRDISVTVDRNTYVFNENVSFRTAPNTGSELINIYLYNEITNGDVNSNYFIKGTVINTIARTNFMEEIDGKSSPWYYVVITDGFEGSQYGWVFGAFFTTYIAESESQYWDTLQRELGLNNGNENDVVIDEVSSEQLLQLDRNYEIAESLYNLSIFIQSNADRTEEKENYYTIYYSNGNANFSNVVQFVNNDFLTNSELIIGMDTSSVIQILGSPTRSSEYEMVYDIYRENEGHGYTITLEIDEGRIQKIECCHEK